ncbi:MAG: PD40 domain-containing protein [Bacteroidales bacterium]|nr:PD40 domain-containing protein [Bacteroidales bacterium]
MHIHSKVWILFGAGIISFMLANAQFYNGHEMIFGKNRVQYNDFFWSFERYEQFDVYFNQDGRQLAEYAADFAKTEIPKIEGFFDYTLDRRIIFIVYNKLSDFRQSNIDLITGKEEYNIGGVTTVSKNKVFLFYEGDLGKFRNQIKGAIARVLSYQMLFGQDLKDNMTNSTLINLPSWYFEGLISYLSNNWDYHLENRTKDGIVNGRYEKFNRLTGEDAVIAGHSFWRFIAETYGESVIPNIIYLTRINKNAKSGFLYVLGLSLKELSYEWTGFYLNQYANDEAMEQVPGTGKMIKKPGKKRVYQQIKVNPNGNRIAYVTNESGQYKIWLYDVHSRKKKKILKREHKLEQITDYSYPVLTWHPSGKILAFITEEKGGLKLYYYFTDTRELTVRNLLYFDKIIDFSFSDDGSLFVFSGVKQGKTDIYVHTIAAGTDYQVTDDIADDFHPRFINHSDDIIFSSNRTSDTISIEASGRQTSLSFDLFIYDYKNKSDVLVRLSDNDTYSNKRQPLENSKNTYFSLNDKSGIINRYISMFDSTVSFIDTTVHYRYIARNYPLTNYSRNIIEQDYDSGSGIMGEILYNKGRYHMFQNPADSGQLPGNEIEETSFSKKLKQELTVRDSTRNIKMNIVNIQELKENSIITENNDTLKLGDYKIDINNYIFEREKINLYNIKLKDKNIRLALDTTIEKRPKVRIYQTAFYQNFIVNQVDFSFLNESYQAFTGGAVYFNPGMNVLFKLGTNDLFEDYKIIGGFRLSPDFDSNEYLISLENLKKRVDRQLIFHRQAFKNYGTDDNDYEFIVKTHTHELSYIMRYPFNQVRSSGLTFTYRNDRTVFLSTDALYLEEDNINRNWLGIKVDHIFDNTRFLGTNLYSGTRYKIFAEVYQKISDGFDELVVFGADFRHYLKIHRSLIWANRLAASTSQGSSKLIYYLGGVDNWTNITPLKTPTFIPLSEIPIDRTENYAYQTVATNMRGFSQNIRNGNNFALINSEIRWPVIKYLANYPLSNSFLENFQIVGFFDIGTAWSGKTPWSGENAYDYTEIQRGTIKVTLDSDREPIVAGYGFGLRSQLLGYFLRLDWAWGIENNQIRPRVFYFSLSLDF